LSHKSSAETYIYPHLETVAGDALFKFSASKTIFTVSNINNLSPLANVSTLLSSKTVFKFSIQIASTGPSQTIQLVYLLGFFSLAFLNISEKIPGVHSPAKFLTPYISYEVKAFGFNL
jgi:hypothetical protein